MSKEGRNRGHSYIVPQLKQPHFLFHRQPGPAKGTTKREKIEGKKKRKVWISGSLRGKCRGHWSQKRRTGKKREGTIWHRLKTFPTECKALKLDSGGRHWPEAKDRQKWIPELVV